MKLRFRSWFRGWLFAALAVVQVPALAQTNLRFVPPQVAQNTREVAEVLERGRSFEQQRKWADAVILYEEAVRANPGDRTLEQRFDTAKMHYDLGRRYNDASFRTCLSSLNETQALDLYAEVLLKIHTHYVTNPDWANMISRGSRCLDMALTEPPFADRYLRNVPKAKLDQFRNELSKLVNGKQVRTRQEARDLVAQAERLATSLASVPATATIMEYLAGATGSLDEYSSYLTQDQLTDVYSQIEGNFVGLGIELKSADGTLKIVRVIAGSPAERAGIRSNDRITAVDGRSVKEVSTDQAAEMLQGREGSVCDVVVVTPGEDPRRLRVKREHVDVPSVEDTQILDAESGIGYFKLTCFQKSTSKDVDAALWKLHKDGMRSLIMDLRGNPGGLLTASVEVADKFIEEGTIVSTRGRSQQEDFTYTAHRPGTWRVPLVVLIDGDSASASEIFAGAIRDHHRGTLVGVRSYGKGSVQGIFPLSQSGAGLRLTTSKFYSPNGLPFVKVGVEPDILVRSAAKPVIPSLAPKAEPVPPSAGPALVGPVLGDPGQTTSPPAVVTEPVKSEDAILAAGLQAARKQVASK